MAFVRVGGAASELTRLKDGGLGRHLCWSLVSLSLSACDVAIRTFVYPSPDHKVELVLDAEASGGAAGMVAIDIYLVGKDYGNRKYIGMLPHWPGKPLGWVSNNTINICDFASDPAVKREYDLLVEGKAGDEVRKYRLETNCAPVETDAPAQPPAPFRKSGPPDPESEMTE